MTNIEIKLELAKAALTNSNLMPTDEGLRNLYSWITGEESTEVSEPKTDYDTKPISELLFRIDKNDNDKYDGGPVGFLSRLSKIFRGNDINTVGDLLRKGRCWLKACRNVGDKTIWHIDKALKELYGITNW